MKNVTKYQLFLEVHNPLLDYLNMRLSYQDEQS